MFIDFAILYRMKAAYIIAVMIISFIATLIALKINEAVTTKRVNDPPFTREQKEQIAAAEKADESAKKQNEEARSLAGAKVHGWDRYTALQKRFRGLIYKVKRDGFLFCGGITNGQCQGTDRLLFIGLCF